MGAADLIQLLPAAALDIVGVELVPIAFPAEAAIDDIPTAVTTGEEACMVMTLHGQETVLLVLPLQGFQIERSHRTSIVHRLIMGHLVGIKSIATNEIHTKIYIQRTG